MKEIAIEIGSPKRVLGFTLIELLVTIAVASILLAFAVPSFSGMIVGNRLTTQAHDVIAALNFARSEAIKRNGSVSLCRVASASATACLSTAGAWEHWLIRTATGTVVRRGRINTYGGTISVRSTLTNDQALFGSDGLARTGGALVDNHQINICAPALSTRNLRRVVLGAGSRISTEVPAEGC